MLKTEVDIILLLAPTKHVQQNADKRQDAKGNRWYKRQHEPQATARRFGHVSV